MQDGRFTLRVESVDLASELEDAVYTYFELFRQEGIEVSYKGPDEDVPPIVADSERMKQVFCNVLDNAAKHGGAGKRIDVSAACEDGKFVIRVRDYVFRTGLQSECHVGSSCNLLYGQGTCRCKRHNIRYLLS